MDSYLYFTKHGLGPGMLPKDVKLVKWEDKDDVTAIWTNRPLTSEELEEYDVYSETSDQHEEYKKKYNIFEALTDTDIEFLSQFNLDSEDTSALLSLFELISEDNKQTALNIIEALFKGKHFVFDEETENTSPFNESLSNFNSSVKVSEIYTRRLLGDI